MSKRMLCVGGPFAGREINVREGSTIVLLPQYYSGNINPWKTLNNRDIPNEECTIIQENYIVEILHFGSGIEDLYFLRHEDVNLRKMFDMLFDEYRIRMKNQEK